MKSKPAPSISTAKLFMNGQSQAVRLPKKFRFSGDQVYIKKIGEAVILLPRKGYWQILFDSLDLFSSDFLPKREKSSKTQREEIFE